MLRGDVGKGPLSPGLDQLKHNPLPPSINVFPDDPDNLDSIQAAIEPTGANGKPKPISPAIDRRQQLASSSPTRSARSPTRSRSSSR